MSRIKLYSIALAIIYFLIVGYDLVEGIKTFKAGFKQGWNEIEGKKNNTMPGETLHVLLEPSAGMYSYPDTVMNLITGVSTRIEIEKARIKVSYDPAQMPLAVNIYKVMRILIGLISLGLIMAIPVLFFKIIRAVSQDRILDTGMIKKLNKMGWILISYNLIGILVYLGEALLMAPSILHLENYNIIVNISDYTTLIVGIITLLISEILKVSLGMKEEQELTI